MKIIKYSWISLILLIQTQSCKETKETSAAQNPWGYYFEQPASIWEESIPLGNGRIGFMPWGGINQERIILNEKTVWSGGVQEADNPESYQYLAQIRQLLFEGKNKEAQDLMQKTFVCKGEGGEDKTRYGNYQNFGNLYIDFPCIDTLKTTSAYKRTLDMNNALSITSFQNDGTLYTREYFTSLADDIGVIRIRADKAKALDLKLFLQRDENYKTKIDGNELHLYGQMKSNASTEGVKYFGLVKVLNSGGTVEQNNDSLMVKQADEVILLVSLATDFGGEDAEQKSRNLLSKADTDYDRLKNRHIKEYQKLFNRMDVTLPKNENSALPIDKRLEAFQKDSTDIDLVGLYMQFGRYLLISSAKAGELPPNLQGLWAPQIYTPWNGDYHLNINLQMNFWGAELTNLSELHLPLVEYIRGLVPSGEKTAKTYYNSRGWVSHVLANAWNFTSPSENPSWGATNTTGAWACQHLWQHYEYTLDKEYLKSVYPVIKGAAQFFDDMLILDPRNNYLVTAPTTSPENAFIINGEAVNICAGSTMDNQIVRELFTNTIQAANILGVDTEWCEALKKKMDKLAPTTIGKHGQVMEWLEDYEEADVHHRHVSHLYGLHPSNQITETKTPELMEAAKVTLDRRGDMSTGWSMAWKINFWARLKDGNRAFKQIRSLLKPAQEDWGTYPALFSSHPPMQIDGNFGGSAGIAEMLLHSHDGFIDILPALPDLWKEGEVRGIKARGGAELSYAWNNNNLTKLSIKSETDHTHKIKLPKAFTSISKKAKYNVEGDMLSLEMKKGDIVDIGF